MAVRNSIYPAVKGFTSAQALEPALYVWVLLNADDERTVIAVPVSIPLASAGNTQPIRLEESEEEAAEGDWEEDEWDDDDAEFEDGYDEDDFEDDEVDEDDLDDDGWDDEDGWDDAVDEDDDEPLVE